MRTTIDDAGRLLIPKEIRRQAGLRPGMALEVTNRDGRVEIEVASPSVRLVRRGRLLVAVSDAMPVLRVDTVEETRQALADDRGL